MSSGTWRDPRPSSPTSAIVRNVVEMHLGDLLDYVAAVRAHAVSAVASRRDVEIVAIAVR